MKKNIGIVLLFVLQATVALSADSYWVMLVRGGVFSSSSSKPLKIGDKLETSSSVRFSDVNAYIVVMGSKGKFTIKPEPKKNAQNEFVAFVNSALLPIKSTGRLSTRGEEEGGITDMNSYFGEDKFVFIGNTHKVEVNPRKFELDATKFLVFRYQYKTTIINKKIAFEGSTLLFDRNALFTTSEGKAINPEEVKEVEIYKYDVTSHASAKISSFSPLYLNEEQLKEQLSAAYFIYSTELGLTKAQAEEELLKFVLDVYGKTDPVVLKGWIQENVIR